jgi:hypothetical protein
MITDMHKTAGFGGPTSPSREEQLVYLFCVTDKEPRPKEIDSLVGNLYFVCHKGLYAVVGRVEESEFGEQNLKRNLADLEWIKAKTNMHEKIIETVMRNSSVIPFKFATCFNTDDSLKAMLEEYAEEFKAILKKLEDKEEWGVKIYCDIEKLKDSLANDEPEILEIENEINLSSPGKAYLLKKKKTELIEDTLNKKINEYGQETFELLKELSSSARINKLLPKEVTEREDDMVLNSAFLVGKDKVGDFINMIDTLKMHYEGEGLFFDCTGPWPPYNFCSLLKEKVQNG